MNISAESKTQPVNSVDKQSNGKSPGYNPRIDRGEDCAARFKKKHPGVLHKFYICPYCGQLVIRGADPLSFWSLEVDHVVPVHMAKTTKFLRFVFQFYGAEGVNSLSNLVPACRTCNQAKSDKGNLWIARGFFGRLLFPIFDASCILACLACIWPFKQYLWPMLTAVVAAVICQLLCTRLHPYWSKALLSIMLLLILNGALGGPFGLAYLSAINRILSF